MARRLLDRPEVAAHDVVTRAMHRSGTDDFDGTAWIPALEVLTRSLDREARLTVSGRRRVRSELVELLVGRRETDTEPGAPRPRVVITGPDASGIAALETALGVAVGRGDRLLRSEFASMSFEIDHHVPAYAEWLADLDHDQVYLDVARRSALTDSASIEVVGAVQFGERLDAVGRAWAGALLVEIERPVDDAADDVAATSVVARSRTGSDVDPAKVERYWRWRLRIRAERRAAAEWTAGPSITLRHDEVISDPASVAARVLAAAT